MTPYLHQIECPVLVVGGGKDVVAGAGGSVVIARAIGANARLEILQEAGHGVYRQAADDYRALLLEFLAQHSLIEIAAPATRR
ncbi:MAG: alpha/beta hydrolase [Dehalococcoidia bacterium]|nr:alpha/beta hydrolase [Dehalococcoidia bacterium]